MTIKLLASALALLSLAGCVVVPYGHRHHDDGWRYRDGYHRDRDHDRYYHRDDDRYYDRDRAYRRYDR